METEFELAVRKARRTAVGLSLLVADGDLIFVGLNAAIGSAAYFLAKATHAPSAWICSNSSVDVRGHTLTFFGDEAADDVASTGQLSFEFLTAYVRGAKRMAVEAIRPLQVDAAGAVNASAVRSRGQLVTVAGPVSIPDLLEAARKRICYVPDHVPQVFPETVDYATARPRDLSARPLLLATELGLFRHEGHGQLIATALWPDADVARIERSTGYGVTLAPDVIEIPGDEYLDELRRIDPYDTITLETMPKAARAPFLRRLLAKVQAPGLTNRRQVAECP